MTSLPNVFDIAREAGVSKSTAARALSGQGSVSAGARAKVLAAAESLHYRANQVARTLRRGDNRLLGVVLPASGSTGFLTHTVSAQKLEGLAMGAKERGFDLQLFIEDMADRDALLRLATERLVRGLFFFSHVAVPVLEHLNDYHIPWVGLNWRQPGRHAADYVWTDFAHAGATLAGHLFDHGCRSVLAFDWLSDQYGPYDDGFTQAVFDRNLPYAALEVKSGKQYFTAAPTVQALRTALAAAARPDGLVLGSAAAALAVYRWLQAERPDLVIGRDLKIVCFDDFDQTAALRPALTCYAQNLRQVGRVAVDVLMARLEGAAPRGEHAVPGELQVRASSGGLPADEAPEAAASEGAP